MKVINVDDETISLLEGAAVTLEAALGARARRVDPDGLISRSLEMSRIKTTEALRQLRRPAPKDWSSYTEQEQATVVALMLAVMNGESDHVQSLAFRKLRGALFRYQGEQAEIFDAADEPSGPSGALVVQKAPDRTAEKKAAVRERVRKNRNRNPSPSKAL